MFADSLLDSHWESPSRRRWTAVLSFALQAGLVTFLAVLPLLYNQVLPQVRSLRPELTVPAPAPATESPAVRSTARNQSNFVGSRLMTPDRIPTAVRELVESVAPEPAPDLDAFAVPNGIRGGNGNVLHGILGMSAARPPQPPAPTRPARVVQQSRVMEGYLVHKVVPVYPQLAIQTRTQGTVILHAVISKDGTVENLQVVSGHPLLVRAAIEAVRQWKYRPFYLNDVPVEVETQVTVNFTLGG